MCRPTRLALLLAVQNPHHEQPLRALRQVMMHVLCCLHASSSGTTAVWECDAR